MTLKKNTKTALIITGIIILIIIILLVVRKAKAAKAAQLETEDPEQKKRTNNPGSSKPASEKDLYASLPTGTFPVKQGDKNKLVYMLQYALNEIDNAGLDLDADFGPATAAALKKAYNISSVDFLQAKGIYNDFKNEKGQEAKYRVFIEKFGQLFV